jgi:transcriptional regulator with XRE-family HTH domain
MEISFSDWLREQLKERGWNQAELSRRSGISQPHITKALNGERNFGEQSIKAIAEALQFPPEKVFRIAGILPPISKERSQLGELTYLINLLDDNNLQEVIDYARHRLEKQEGTKQTSRRGAPARTALKDK